MKVSELRNKNVSDLLDELKNLLRESFNLRVQKAMGQPVKPHVFTQARRSIARIKTLLREKAGNNE